MKQVFIFLALAIVSGLATLFFFTEGVTFYALICLVCFLFTTFMTIVACEVNDRKLVGNW